MDNITIIGNNCTGCVFCKFVCPKKCIHLEEDSKNGHFLYPTIEKNKCISCGKCLSNCPVQNTKKTSGRPLNTFLLYSKNTELLESSTSGGTFGLLALFIFTTMELCMVRPWTKNLKVEHIRIDSVKDIHLLQKSKHIQSYVSEKVYLQLKKDVSKNKKLVLFVGTPCQCFAVSQLFKNNKPDNLIIADIICHGVPSQWLFNRWKLTIEKIKDIVVESFSFRVKKEGFGVKNFAYLYRFNKNGKYRIAEGSSIYNVFLSSFYNETVFRQSCYSCSFRGFRSFSDLTLGDFWNLEKIDKTFSSSDSKSLLIVNSLLGRRILNQSINGSNCIFKDYPVDICLKSNAAYYNNPSKQKPSFDVLAKWEKDNYVLFYDLKMKILKPYHCVKNLIKKMLNRKTPLLFWNDIEA